MSIDRLRAHYGFSRMPFGKDLAPGMLHTHDAHAQAVARIGWCIAEQAIGVISGECGAGKTVAARAAVAGLDASRHTVLYLGTPGVGLRGIYGLIVTRLGGTPKFHHAALIPQAQELLAAETPAGKRRPKARPSGRRRAPRRHCPAEPATIVPLVDGLWSFGRPRPPVLALSVAAILNQRVGQHSQQSLAAVAAAGHSGGPAPVVWCGGRLVAAAWVAWRFGPAIARASGVVLGWIGFMGGIENAYGNAYGYAVFFVVIGVAAWRGGTAWHIRRHGSPPLAAARFFRQSSQVPGAIPPPLARRQLALKTALSVVAAAKSSRRSRLLASGGRFPIAAVA